MIKRIKKALYEMWRGIKMANDSYLNGNATHGKV